MKLNTFILALLITVAGCSKDENKVTEPDYAVLGITLVTINDEQISVTGGSLLNVDQNESIAMDGLEDQKTHKHLQLSYVVTTNSDTDLSIEVESSFNNVSITYNQETNGNQTTYIAVVTREGYDEQITYIFHRIIISISK
jgi:hypothetical protein